MKVHAFEVSVYIVCEDRTHVGTFVWMAPEDALHLDKLLKHSIHEVGMMLLQLRGDVQEWAIYTEVRLLAESEVTRKAFLRICKWTDKLPHFAWEQMDSDVIKVRRLGGNANGS